jgi:hypothetical protein
MVTHYSLWVTNTKLHTCVSIYIYIYSLALQPPWSLASDFLVSWSLYTLEDSFNDWSARRKASTWTQDNTNRINTYTYQISFPCVGFEPTIPASEPVKTVHVLDRSATVIGSVHILVWHTKTGLADVNSTHLTWCVDQWRSHDKEGAFSESTRHETYRSEK